MIFVDSNVFIYAVGRSHPLRREAQSFFVDARKEGKVLVTSAEVLQELLHVYIPVGRFQTLDAALELASGIMDRIIPVDSESVHYARQLADKYRSLTARDLLHLSVCLMQGIEEIRTFDRNLLEAFRR